ncbi:MFS transporter [Campylobacter sp. 19-13652]|uniref:MFS transporter n=1 Tax=Campylobacter sp. 19-13652 TaxID=2840180 RepID=UPI001C73EB9B|nr:MFS transporter [Campylobacter sp. 19-13652]BCX78786.1 MFS transporter [Campylobacter sp. 19-13652]
MRNKWLSLAFLILGAGTVFKLSSIKDVFYVPMQDVWGLTNTQIGLAFTFYAIVQTVGYFTSMYIADRFSKKILLPIGLVGVGLCGVYMTTLPGYVGYCVAFGVMALFGEVIYWPSLLKAVRLLGDKSEQGRLFGFLEAGRGIVDVIVAFGALFVFGYFGEGKAGLMAGLWYYTIVTSLIGVITYFLIDNDDAIKDRDNANKIVWQGIWWVLKDAKTWLAAFVIFFVYSAYTGLTYFIPFMKDIYALPAVYVGAYGIINQYGLKLFGGVIGGTLSDKVFHSPLKYLRFTFLVAAAAIVGFAYLPHESINITLGMVITLCIGAIIFTQRAVFFAPMDEIGTPREYAGSAMALGCLIGYMPSMFGYLIYGYIIDTFAGMAGYRYVFLIMASFALCGFICASLLLSKLRKDS